MTYIDYINLFWKTSQNVKFSSNEAHLYFFLLSECNIRGWENPFECPNKRIILSIGISEPTLIDCRNRLQSKGLLMFEAGKRNEKSPVYYLNDLSKEFSKTFSKRFSKDLSKNLSKDPSILYKTKDNKRKEKDINIPPTPPEGEAGKENELRDREEALRALEKELADRERALASAQETPAKPKQEPSSLNAEARKVFEDHFQNTFSSSYYWTAKDAGSMSSLLRKLKFQREKKKMVTDDAGILEALRYLLRSIDEGWIFENFSVTNINSKFNEIVSQVKARRNGQTNSDMPKARAGAFGQNTGNKAASREAVGQFARAVLEQYKSKDGD